MIALSAFILFCVLIVIIIWRDRRTLKDSTVCRTLLDLPLIRHTLIFMGDNEDRMTVFKKLAYAAYSNEHGISTIYVGPHPIVFVSDSENALAVLKGTISKGHAGKVGRRLIGNGLIFAPVKIWQRRRKLLFPSFSSKHLVQFVHVFESQTNMVVKRLESHVGKGNFSMREYVSLIALDSICETAFGINLKIQKQRDNRHPLVDDLNQYLKNVAALFCRPLLNVDMIYHMLPISKEQQRLKQSIFKFIDDVIYKKKAIMTGEFQNIEELNGAEESSVTM